MATKSAEHISRNGGHAMIAKRKAKSAVTKRDQARDRRREIGKANRRASKPTVAPVSLPPVEDSTLLLAPPPHYHSAGGGEFVWLANPTGGKPIPERWPHDAPAGVKHGTVLGRTKLDDQDMFLSLDELVMRYPATVAE